MKVSVEIGGTFTDVLLVSDEGHIVEELKVPSTPKDPEVGVFNALEELAKNHPKIKTIAHGSTIATNAVLERKGIPVGLLLTRGFRDLMEIQRHDREDIYDIRYEKPKPIVSRDHVFEITERTLASGEILQNLDEDEVLKALEKIIKAGLKSVAVNFLHSYANPKNEQRIKDMASSRWPDLQVTLSSEILPEFREYERASTTCISAYVMPLVDRYLSGIERGMGRYGGEELWMMQSNGGALPSSLARQHGERTILSGPAGGVAGAYRLASAMHFSRVITFDMGGTSLDVSLITEGQPETTTDSKIGGLPLKVPMLDIISLGAGGGSIAWLDSTGMLHVGPESQGADPGPACYLRGGNIPTVTDANVFLGLIRPGNFLGGKMKLGVTESQKAIEKLAQKMGKESTWVAEGIIRLVNNNMALGIRLISTERGYNPRDYVLTAFGGAGPLHAVYVAEELGIEKVFVPRYPGLLSAYGLLVSDFKRDYVLCDISDLEKMDVPKVRDIFNTLEQSADEELSKYHFDEEFGTLRINHFLDLRYKGQAYELTIPFNFSEIEHEGLELLKKRFNQTHKKKYGYLDEQQNIELINYRLEVSVPQRQPLEEFRHSAEINSEVISTPVEKNAVYLSGSVVECSFYSRSDLPIGFRFSGPAVVEEPTSATLILEGWTGTIDDMENILIRKGGD